jgi:glycosyltransferase involved in cell wall biosynthesis
MKIAYIFDLIYPYDANAGGVGKRIREIAKRLAAKGHEVTLFGMKHWKGEDIIYEDGLRLWGVCPPIDIWEGNRRSIKEAIYFGWRVLFPLLKEKYDVIDCQNFPYFPCFAAKFHSIFKKSKLVITWIEVWDRYWYEYLGLKGAFGWMIERCLVKLSKKHIAISESTMRSLLAITMRGDITVVPCGIDLQQLGAVFVSEASYDIVSAGRLIKEKNIDLLIRAVGLIRESKPDVKCLIIGDGPERGKLVNLVTELGLGQNINFTGFLERADDVFAFMKSAKVFVLPSTREGFGIVVLEANACGLPVIAVRHPKNAACDLISDGENGFLCMLDAVDMAQKIHAAMIKTQNMSKDCVKLAGKYEWYRIAEMCEGVYQSTLKHKTKLTMTESEVRAQNL